MLWNYQNRHRTYCKCIGIDGNEYIIRQDALISGATHTVHGACSSGKQHDITGKRFGRLIALESSNQRASNGSVRWKCLCDCGNILYPTLTNLKRGHTTSCGCAKKDYVESTKIDVIGKKFGYLTVLEEYFSPDNKRRMVRCLCDCGNINIVPISDLTSQHTVSCGCIFKSKGETYIKELLEYFNIDYIPQKRFDDCKHKKSLPFDFYLPKYNLAIEYDGRQHFEPIEHWGGEKRFIELQKHDDIKNTYCKNNNINLIRIPYTKTKQEIYEIIFNLLNPATITV